MNKYSNIRIQGELPELYDDILYTIEVEYEKKGQYANYIVKRFYTKNEKISKSTTEKFLKAILTENQANELLRHYSNIIELVIKGEKIDTSILYGITDKMIKNLCEAYPSIEVIKKK